MSERIPASGEHSVTEGSPYPEKLPSLVEQAAGEFIVGHFVHVQEVRPATPQDDSGIAYDQKGFDLVLVWDNGMRMAVDVTITQDSTQLRKKMGPRLPLVMEHDREGTIVAKDIPQATVSFSPKGTEDWYQARERWLANGREGKISDWLQAPVAMKMEILTGLYRSFEGALARSQVHADQFKTALKTLELEMAEVAEEASRDPSSRRELRELAERIRNPLTRRRE